MGSSKFLAFSFTLSLYTLASVVAQDSSYWVASIPRQGTVAFGEDSAYQIYRNVKDFGALGNGQNDDTEAINAAISSGNRCGQGCDSSTITPALVYFPPGTYSISAPIIQYYYTQLVGDAVSVPTIVATAAFTGIALIDADPYVDGVNWYTNQNNFFRQIRNFIIDITAMPVTAGAGIHWQVAQATSLQNIVFNMRTDGGASNTQVGIFMDNGSGGYLSDLVFNGGGNGAFLGNQQFTSQNLTFQGCKTAIYMNWNWGWTLQGITINNAEIGIDMSSGGSEAQDVGSIILFDSTISNTGIGIYTYYRTVEPGTNGTLILDNVDMSNNVPVAVSDAGTNATILSGNAIIDSWIQGREYWGPNTGTAVQGSTSSAQSKPAVLLNGDGTLFTRSKPQYESVPLSSFLSAKDYGAKGDGITDDTAAIQALFDSASFANVVYFDHGAYLVTDTIKVPTNVRITGEIWSIILAGGSAAFSDQSSPQAVFQVGQPGDVGAVEMSDLIFETLGPQPGAILVEWNIAEDSQGSAGMWDVHFRIGGSAGTQLQSDVCSKNPSVIAPANAACEDHELDLPDHNQINIFNGRGILIESSSGPVWTYGTSSEHSVLYNFQLVNASNVFMGFIQSETPYFQSNPSAVTPFTVSSSLSDPDFATSCGASSSCAKSWGLRVVNSQDIFVYGAGLYSFFDNYSQECLTTESCQDNMVSLEGSNNVILYGLNTKAATNMVTMDGLSAATDGENRNTFCATIALFQP